MPDGVFRELTPDIPLDAVPLAREAALAGDADRLDRRQGDYYLNRLNHTGPAPFAEFVHVYNAARIPPTVGCGSFTLAELTVVVPGDGVLVIIGHANVKGIARAGGGLCGGGEKTIRFCAPAGPDIDLPSRPDLPSIPTPNLPPVGGNLDLPPLPSFGAGLAAPSASSCLPWELTVPDGSGGGRSGSKGGRAGLSLIRPDLAKENQVLSYESREFDPDVYSGLRLDASATIKVERNTTIKLQLLGWMAGDPGFGEQNLTAMFFPMRR